MSLSHMQFFNSQVISPIPSPLFAYQGMFAKFQVENF